MRLLLVEDYPPLAEAIGEALARAGFTVDHAGTAREARAMAVAADYALVLLDLGLPDGDGLRLLPILRAGGRVPMIVLTARDALEDRLAGLDVGADDYLLKPVEMSELAARCRAVLRRPGERSATTLQQGPVASRLTSRLFVIAAAALVVNMLAVGLYYGVDRRAMEGEVVEHRLGLVAEAVDPASGRVAASARALYDAHPDAYAFVVAHADGRVLDAANAGLVPRRAFEEATFADDWLAHRTSGSRSLLIASQKATLGGRELRLVFVMRDDPAHLLPRALLAEFVGHIWLPIVPVVVLLIAANAVLIRRGLSPVTAAARWARSIRPGQLPAPLPAADLPSEIIDLVDATRRSLDRLNDALSAEKRRAAEAAHALRTPVAVLAARLDALPPGPAADQLRVDVVALARTVRQVLASANADALQVDESVRTDLGAGTSRVATALAAFAALRGVELALELPAVPIIVAADPDALELAISNVVENAIVHGVRAWSTSRSGPAQTCACAIVGREFRRVQGDRCSSPSGAAPMPRPVARASAWRSSSACSVRGAAMCSSSRPPMAVRRSCFGSRSAEARQVRVRGVFQHGFRGWRRWFRHPTPTPSLLESRHEILRRRSSPRPCAGPRRRRRAHHPDRRRPARQHGHRPGCRRAHHR